MRRTINRELFNYWNTLRGERAAPDRASVDPLAIRSILADTFIIEVDADGLFPLRVAGARVNALWLADLKGTSFLDLWRNEDRRSVHAALMSVVDGVAPLVGGARGCAPGDVELEIEFLLLPLRHFGRTHSRVLGSLSPMRGAEAIGQMRVGSLEFLSMRMIDAPRVVAAASPDASPPRPRLVVCNPEKS